MKQQNNCLRLTIFNPIFICILMFVGPQIYMFWRNMPSSFPALPENAVDAKYKVIKTCYSDYDGCSKSKTYFVEASVNSVKEFYEKKGAFCYLSYDEPDCTEEGCDYRYFCYRTSDCLNYNRCRSYTVEIQRSRNDDKTFFNVRVRWFKYDTGDLLEEIATILSGEPIPY